MKEKKLTIGFSLNRGKGGPAYFLKKLRNALERENLAKTSLFLNPFTDCNIYANIVRNPWKRPYFFRVDGIGFDVSKSNEHIHNMNSKIIDGINNSIGVIYQTKFSKKLSEKILGIKPDNYKIIINGTDQILFSEKGENYRDRLGIENEALVFITSAKWRPHKRLKDVINVFKLFSKNYEGITYLIAIGADTVKKEENIIFIPYVENNELPYYLRSADIYLFFSWLDSCPNSVVEAISCGLPVICTNNGGTKEILEVTNGGIVVEADEEFNYERVDLSNPPVPDYNKLLEAMLEISNNLGKYKKRINKKKIDINYVAKEYYEFFKDTLQKG